MHNCSGRVGRGGREAENCLSGRKWRRITGGGHFSLLIRHLMYGGVNLGVVIGQCWRINIGGVMITSISGGTVGSLGGTVTWTKGSQNVPVKECTA